MTQFSVSTEINFTRYSGSTGENNKLLSYFSIFQMCEES